MGPAESAVYRQHCRERLHFARGDACVAAPSSSRDRSDRGENDDLGESLAQMAMARRSAPPAPIRVATELALARMLDRAGDLPDELRRLAPVVLVDVPDPRLLEECRWIWRRLFEIEGRVLYLDKATAGELSADYAVSALILTEPLKPRDRQKLEPAAISALSWGKPIICLSPSAVSFVPSLLVQAATHRLTLPAFDAEILARTIRIVTGRRCRPNDLNDLHPVRDVTALAVAIRHDRDPAECIAVLRRLEAARHKQRGGRDLALDELHGLEPAVDWARSTIADLAAWRRGEIPWDAVDRGVVLDGPPGTGKTLFAQVFSQASGLPLVSGSLAKWQSNGHLGDLLKAMRTDFDRARGQAPAILFIDEVDSFPRRDGVTHDHKDYVIEVVNGFIEQLDGIEGREGLIFIAASNNISRCDPAIIRSGRLNRVIRIDLPNADARARMLRVRLGPDLPEADLGRVARLTEFMSGADIERLVKDARRRARQVGRALLEEDLLSSIEVGEERSPAQLRRTAIHEAAHAIVAVLLTGPDGVTVTLQNRDGAAGWMTRRRQAADGTRSELEKEIAVLLAGRAGEELVYGEPSAGAGGVPGSDLHAATRLAAAMVGSLGLGGPTPLVFAASLADIDDVLAYPHLHRATVEILNQAEERARRLLVAHRPVLDRLADALVTHRHLDGETVAELIAEARATERSSPRRRPRKTVRLTSRKDRQEITP